MRTLRSPLLAAFRYTVLFTIVRMFWITFPGLTYFITESFHPFWAYPTHFAFTHFAYPRLRLLFSLFSQYLSLPFAMCHLSLLTQLQLSSGQLLHRAYMIEQEGFVFSLLESRYCLLYVSPFISCKVATWVLSDYLGIKTRPRLLSSRSDYRLPMFGD